MKTLHAFVGTEMKRNLLEALTQVGAGTVLIFFSNLLIFKMLGIEASTTDNLLLVSINTIVAFAKSYSVRYFFQKLESQK
jgi:putative effector of murein hydrolase